RLGGSRFDCKGLNHYQSDRSSDRLSRVLTLSAVAYARQHWRIYRELSRSVPINVPWRNVAKRCCRFSARQSNLRNFDAYVVGLGVTPRCSSQRRTVFSSGSNATVYEYLATHADLGAVFNRFMTAQSHLHNAAIADAYDFSDVRTLV